MQSVMGINRLITKFILSNLLITLISEFCFFQTKNVTVEALFEEAIEQMSGKVIRILIVNVSKIGISKCLFQGNNIRVYKIIV